MISGNDCLRIADAIIAIGVVPSRFAVSKTFLGCRHGCFLADRVRRPEIAVSTVVVARLKSRLAQLAMTTPAELSRDIRKIVVMIEQAEAIAVFIAR